MATGDHLIHGLRVRLGREVPGALPAEGRFDYSVEPLVTAHEQGGPVLAGLGNETHGYVAERLGARGMRVRYHRVGEFEVDQDAAAIRRSELPSAPPGLSDVLLQGGVLALALGDAGIAVLHASTVSLRGGLVAFVGPSGAGKSTAAALACAAGAELFGDDTLRVDVDGGGHVVHRGIAELRLRASASSLAELMPRSRRMTADGRTAVAPAAVMAATGTLRAMLAPRWRRDLTSARLRKQSPGEALRTLLGAPRVVGWRALVPIRANFAASAELARSVPVWDLELPHGRPLEAALAAELCQALVDSGVV